MTTTEADIRREVLDWFRSEWDPNLPLLEWRDRFVTSGWA
ncbi:MAG: hypothetical protein ACI91Q_002711, partial [Gammaproteobacteria bacterium]